MPGVSPALSQRRDSALVWRDRAVAAGALKNNVPAMILAETMLQASEQALQAGDQSRALSGYVAVVDQYRKARTESLTLEDEARRMLERVAPVVRAIPGGPDAATAGVLYSRAESLLNQKDFTMAKVAAQSAEQVAINAGIAPASPQPPDARGAIEVLLTDLGRALSSERVGNVRVLYPTMTDREAADWESFFREWDRITARFTIEQFSMRLGANAASGNVRAVFEYIPAGGGAPRIDRRLFAMRFARHTAGWRLAGVRDVR